MQEYWSGLPFPSPEDLPDPGIQLTSVNCIGRWILYHLARGGKCGEYRMTSNEYGISFEASVLKLDCGNIYTTLHTY